MTIAAAVVTIVWYIEHRREKLEIKSRDAAVLVAEAHQVMAELSTLSELSIEDLSRADNAEVKLRIARGLDPANDRVDSVRAALDFVRDRLDSAEGKCARVIERPSKDVLCMEILALVSQRKKKHEEAVSRYEQGIEHFPDRASLHLGLSRSLLQLRKVGRARTSANRAQNLGADRAEVAHLIGAIAHIEGNYREARDAMYFALSEEPNDGRGRRFLAEILLLAGNSQEALENYEKAFLVNTSDYESYIGAAWSSFELGADQEALRYLDLARQNTPRGVTSGYKNLIALEKRPERELFYSRLGDFLLEMRERNKADYHGMETVLLNAAKMTPDPCVYEKIRGLLREHCIELQFREDFATGANTLRTLEMISGPCAELGEPINAVYLTKKDFKSANLICDLTDLNRAS